jgi:SAM-dependent methyltransferase
MNEVFGSAYADAYDWLYQDKNYGAECDLIHRVFQSKGHGSIRSILDLGCGTGNHALPLAQQGYEVVGVDRSEAMLDQARRKAANLPPDSPVVLHQGEIRNVDLGRRFDAALMMFTVLGYHLENADALSALRTARRHVNSGGLFIFDVMYGPAVLHQRPSQRVKVIQTPHGKVLRVASGELDIRCQLCIVHYHLWRLERNRLVAETEECHPVRYFFPLELDLLLECTGFSPLRVGAFPEFDHDPDETTWNVMGVARAI